MLNGVLAAGDLDTTFGGTGIVTTAIGSSHDHGWSVAIQSDGKIVVAGDSDSGGNADFAVVRYDPDGTLDTSFSGDGIVTTPVSSSEDEAWSVAIQADGKLVAAGRGDRNEFAVVRYNSDGSLDSSFGSGGKVITGFGEWSGCANDVAIQSDGKIVASGAVGYLDEAQFAVVRYNPDGTLDTSFSGDGKQTTSIRPWFGYEFGIGEAIQPDGKIIVVGYSVYGWPSGNIRVARDIALVRYNPDGELDTSFSGDGMVTTSVGSEAIACQVALQPEGKIVVVGSSYNGSDYDLAVVRYNCDGMLDTTFSEDGILTTEIGSSTDIGNDVAIQSDGRIVVAGWSYIGSNYDFAVVRFNPNGTLDTSFSEDGKVTTPIGPGDDLGCGMAIQSDGRIVVAGGSDSGSNCDFAVVRYRGDPVIPDPDRFESNDTRVTATDAGVGPGIHLDQLTIHTTTDKDWYRFEVLRPDDLDVRIDFDAGLGALGLEVTSDAGVVLATGTPFAEGVVASLAGLAPGTYYAHIMGVAGEMNEYSLSIEPGPGSSTRVFYVNDSSTVDDYYTRVPGDDSNNGLSPDTPKATVQRVLADYDLGPTDVVVIDTGTYGGSTVTISAEDEAAAYAGTPAGSDFNYGGTRFELVDADHNLIYGLRFVGGGGTGVAIRPGVANDSTDNVVQASTFSGTDVAVRIENGSNNLVLDNTITGAGSYGVYVYPGGSATIQGNRIVGRTYGVYSYSSAALVVEDNELAGGNYGLYQWGGTATVTGNNVHDCIYGAYLWGGSAWSVSGNTVHHNTTGIWSDNTAAVIYGNEVHDNGTGLGGYGVFGGVDWSAGQPNDVYGNTMGILPYYGTTVRFNRIHENGVGISTSSYPVDIHHNVIYRNTGQGILVDASHDVSIESNTIYATSGDGIRLRNSSYDIVLRNNIIWCDGNYGIYVATDSQQGFTSDYNNLYTTGSGVLVWWQKPFTDIFDWQVEADFDSHSIGYTSPAPTRDDPQFVNPGGDDYHLAAGLSTSIDSGNPASLYDNEPAYNGNRINLGAYGNTTQAASSAQRYVRIDYPNYYADWPADAGRVILWHTYDVGTGVISGNVDIDLCEVGVGKVADIHVVPASSGSYSWSPQDSGITPDTTRRYQIGITSVDYPGLTSLFAGRVFCTAGGSNYCYVNDGSTVGDEYCSAVGNNRNTGRTAWDPKANLLPVLRSYDLGPGETVRIDTGSYIHVRNVLISGNLSLGDDEGATFTGPTDPARKAVIDRANPYTGSTNIEINDGDYVAVRYLTLTGATWASGSTTAARISPGSI